jgi:phospholipase D-like protein
MTISLVSRPLRPALREVISTVRDHLVVASPFIRAQEARWLLSELGTKRSQLSRVDVLTDVRAECVLNGSLELEALSLLADNIRSTNIINLPRLHAKTYVADRTLALVTSANLTPSGLDSNFEYGVGISDEETVGRIRSDLQRYMQIGNTLDRQALEQLKSVSAEIQAAIQPIRRAHEKEMAARFRIILKRGKAAFLQAQVGPRSAQALFSDAIVYLLSFGPLRTTELHPRIKELYPDLCNDAEILIINAQEFGKKWKHAVRNVQQALKRAGKIEFDGRVWKLR